MKSAVPDIDGQTTLHDGTTTVTVANGLPVKLLTELTLGTHTFNLNSVDNVENADTATVTFNFSEAPTVFSLADTSAVGGTLSNLKKVSATQYTATFTAVEPCTAYHYALAIAGVTYASGAIHTRDAGGADCPRKKPARSAVGGGAH